ncbi:MAG: DUF2851 family protein [Muribaculaceae bacterium]
MMESLMQYVWQHRLWRASDMTTTDGRRVRVIDPGLLNGDAGPDFFNAKIEIDGKLWVGNVEIHVRATDWHRHGHDTDRAYDSVILHVVEKDDAPVRRSNGEVIPQMVLRCSPLFSEHYARLTSADSQLPCAKQIKTIPQLTITEWIERLAFERLQSKVDRLLSLYDSFCGSWEDVCYVTFARNLGFGINNDAFEMLARRMPLRLLHKHSDSIFQIEALLFGQAGLLSDNRLAAVPYYSHLQKEYAFLANKFELRPMDGSMWKSFRIRPQNFPFRRIALLAHYVEGGFNLMTDILERKGEKQLRELFMVRLNGFWGNHYTFGGAPSEGEHCALSNSSIDIILINTVAPLFYAYGIKTDSYATSDRAIELLESLRPERNSIVSLFGSAGIKCDDALTSQALIQLRREYCEARKCLYCKIGHRLLSEAARAD